MEETKTPANSPNTKVNLIRHFFGCTLQEMKALLPKDRDELGSAIARSKGLTEADCGFPFVAY